MSQVTEETIKDNESSGTSSEIDSQPDHSDFKDIFSNRRTLGLFGATCIRALGVVFGDIGTSPLYVFSTIFPNGPVEEIQVLGALCLILYTLTWIVCIKYMIFIMRADYKGEGGVFALVSLILHTKGYANPYLTLDNAGYNDEDQDKKSNESVNTSRDDPHEHKLGSISNFSQSLDISRTTSVMENLDIHLNPSFKSLEKLKKSDFLNKPPVRHFYAFISLIGAGLLLGDGVITPSISVLSALEGLDGLGNNFNPAIVPLTVIILALLFMSQRFGTSKVGVCFGPIMLVWFLSIALLGIYQLSQSPSSFSAFNPYYGYIFFVNNGEGAWRLMGSIFLCVTGCEAMFADIGHFGKNPVRGSWLFIVYPSLLLNYLGQGSLLISNPAAFSNPFYSLVPVSGLYIPMIILSTLATVIASQALISGAFSITQQAISLGTFPRMKVVHTSESVEGQIYIPALNYILMIVCVILVVSFQTSNALASAYGLAVCGDMTMSTFLFCSISRFRWRWPILPWLILLICLATVDSLFLSSTLLKVPTGGYVPLLIATIVATVTFIWRTGKEKITIALKKDQIDFPELQKKLNQEQIKRCPGTAVFLSSLSQGVPVSVHQLTSHIPYLPEKVIFLTIKHMHVPHVREGKKLFIEPLPEVGFYRVIGQYGYRDSKVSLEELLNYCAALLPEEFHHIDMSQVSFFLSTEHIRINKARWIGHRIYIRIFKTILQFSYSIAETFKIPSQSLIIMGSELYL